MASQLRNERFHIGGMTCTNCEHRIESTLKQLPGVIRVKASYPKGQAEVIYDQNRVSAKKIRHSIRDLDYQVLAKNQLKDKTDYRKSIGILIIIAALYILLSRLPIFDYLPLVRNSMDFGFVFVVGLLTSVHCVAMCGGINLSQSLNQEDPPKTAVLYNGGRLISYTLTGVIVGALGQVVTLDGTFKGVFQILAGVFMIIMGLNLLNLFDGLKFLSLRLPRFLTNRTAGQNRTPLYVGLLNGLMPCGPLQAMQLYALSTASPFAGGLSMLLFGLGTLPLMFSLSALSGFLTKKFAQKVMTVGAVIVTVLGLTMFSQGLSLSGFSLPFFQDTGSQSSTLSGEIIDGVQIVHSTYSGGSYPKITVSQSIPVKWTITVTKGALTGCNQSIIIPEYGIEYTFFEGENIITFTPTQSGKFKYSCWMGMIRGTITVLAEK